MTHLRFFKRLQSDEEIAMYFSRKTPTAKLFHSKDGKEIWLPKLGSVIVGMEDNNEGYTTRAAAISAAKKCHNHYCQQLNLRPIY